MSHFPEFRLIVAGGRDFNDYERMVKELHTLCVGEQAPLRQVSVSIVSGMARGADSLAVRFAKEYGVKLYEYPADWSQGKGAGFMRNTEMALFADGLLAYWDGESRGTQHMIDTMNKLGKTHVYVRKY